MPEAVKVVPSIPIGRSDSTTSAWSSARSSLEVKRLSSTSEARAVPGLGAKPVIDVMVGVSQLAQAEGRVGALEGAGYEYVQKYEIELPERRYFRKPRLGPSAYHLHCVVKGSSFWVRHLAFRDYLRAHPESAAAYCELKRELAVRFSKEEYTEAKSPFIERILVSALGHDSQRTAQQRVAPDGR